MAVGKNPKKVKKPTALPSPSPMGTYQPPSPADMLASSVGMASRDAAMAHPQTQRLHKGIHAKMMKAARGQGFNGPGVRGMRSM